MGNWGLMYSFSASMSSKISQLKFGAYKFERVQWSSIKPFENYLRSSAPISPIRSSGGPIFPLLGSLICPLRHQIAPKCSTAPSRAQFPISPIRSFSPPPLFPQCFLFRVSILAIASSKGLKFSIAPSRAPISLSCHQNDHL